MAVAHLWVNDQDEALAFYTKKLGMEVRIDATAKDKKRSSVVSRF
jgi:catechol 2,3-dioxygenase-like lactoylglutathione lyase family enzyme